MIITVEMIVIFLLWLVWSIITYDTIKGLIFDQGN